MLEYMQQLSYPLDVIYYNLLERCIKKEKIFNAAHTRLIYFYSWDCMIEFMY